MNKYQLKDLNKNNYSQLKIVHIKLRPPNKIFSKNSWYFIRMNIPK